MADNRTDNTIHGHQVRSLHDRRSPVWWDSLSSLDQICYPPPMSLPIEYRQITCWLIGDDCTLAEPYNSNRIGFQYGWEWKGNWSIGHRSRRPTETWEWVEILINRWLLPDENTHRPNKRPWHNCSGGPQNTPKERKNRGRHAKASSGGRDDTAPTRTRIDSILPHHLQWDPSLLRRVNYNPL